MESCIIHKIQHVMGKKWSVLILDEIKNKNGLSFNEIEEVIKGITPKVLTERLDEFLVNELVERIVLQESPLKVRYVPTKKGIDLLDVFVKLKSWGVNIT